MWKCIKCLNYHIILHRIFLHTSSFSLYSVSSAITCGHPGNPANGRTNGSEFNLNDVVNFTCNRGYVLSGNARAHCRLNGQWSSPLPVCKGQKHECEWTCPTCSANACILLLHISVHKGYLFGLFYLTSFMYVKNEKYLFHRHLCFEIQIIPLM